MTVERVRQAAGVAPGDDWLDRLQTTMKERHEQVERLQEELRKANEAIVVLKGRLESAGREGSSGGTHAANLEAEIKTLGDALQAAQQAERRPPHAGRARLAARGASIRPVTMRLRRRGIELHGVCWSEPDPSRQA